MLGGQGSLRAKGSLSVNALSPLPLFYLPPVADVKFRLWGGGVRPQSPWLSLSCEELQRQGAYGFWLLELLWLQAVSCLESGVVPAPPPHRLPGWWKDSVGYSAVGCYMLVLVSEALS